MGMVQSFGLILKREMKTTTYIHIGYHKTGSTFLQKRIFPKLPVNLITAPDINYISDSETFDPDLFTAEVKKRPHSAKFAKTVISQEGFSGSSDGNPARDPFRIGERLKQAFPEGKIIIVTRDPEDYILSLYAFRVAVRGLETRTLERYLKAKGSQLSKKLDYSKLIDHYKTLFGEDSVLVLTYEELKTSPHQFTAKLADFIGEKFNETISFSPENRGIRSIALLKFHRTLNIFAGVTIYMIRNFKLAAPGYSWPIKLYFFFKRYILNPILKICFGMFQMKQLGNKIQ
jgi:hypothetical protein